MIMPIQDLILGITVSLGFLLIGAVIGWAFTTKQPKRESPPKIPTAMPYTRIKKTSETQYGKNLLDLAEKIYLSDLGGMAAHPDTKARLSVQKANELLSEVELFCYEMDRSRNKRAREELKKIFSNKQSEC